MCSYFLSHFLISTFSTVYPLTRDSHMRLIHINLLLFSHLNTEWRILSFCFVYLSHKGSNPSFWRDPSHPILKQLSKTGKTKTPTVLIFLWLYMVHNKTFSGADVYSKDVFSQLTLISLIKLGIIYSPSMNKKYVQIFNGCSKYIVFFQNTL